MRPPAQRRSGRSAGNGSLCNSRDGGLTGKDPPLARTLPSVPLRLPVVVQKSGRGYTSSYMVRPSTHRLITTLLVVLLLLFSQLVLANYACPGPAPAAGEMPAMQMALGEPCELMDAATHSKMDQQQPLLCHQHCADAPQSFDGVHAPAVTLPAVVQVLLVPHLLDAGETASVGFAQSVRERPPPHPLFLSTLRLRV